MSRYTDDQILQVAHVGGQERELAHAMLLDAWETICDLREEIKRLSA